MQGRDGGKPYLATNGKGARDQPQLAVHEVPLQISAGPETFRGGGEDDSRGGHWWGDYGQQVVATYIVMLGFLTMLYYL